MYIFVALLFLMLRCLFTPGLLISILILTVMLMVSETRNDLPLFGVVFCTWVFCGVLCAWLCLRPRKRWLLLKRTNSWQRAVESSRRVYQTSRIWDLPAVTTSGS